MILWLAALVSQDWMDDLQKAMAKGRETNRPVCALVTNDDEACRTTIKSFEDPEVKKAADRCVLVKVPWDAPAARILGAQIAPSVFIVEPAFTQAKPSRCSENDRIEKILKDREKKLSDGSLRDQITMLLSGHGVRIMFDSTASKFADQKLNLELDIGDREAYLKKMLGRFGLRHRVTGGMLVITDTKEATTYDDGVYVREILDGLPELEDADRKTAALWYLRGGKVIIAKSLPVRALEPKQLKTLLSKHLESSAAELGQEAAGITKLIDELSNSEVSVRLAAAEKLKALGSKVRGMVRLAYLDSKEEPEARAQLERVLQGIR